MAHQPSFSGTGRRPAHPASPIPCTPVCPPCTLSSVDLSSLNDAQRQAVTHGDGPLLIVAGAGTGKTTVITQRIAWLMTEQGLKTDQVLAVTFTDKAAQEMSDRVAELLPYGYVDVWISTFHALCERILKEHGLDIGLNTDFTLLNETEQWRLIRRNLDRFQLDHYRPLASPTKFIHALLKHFSRAKDEAVSPQDYLAFAHAQQLDRDSDTFVKKTDADDDTSSVAKFTEIAGAYQTYQQLLHESNALDFGDLITLTLKLFRERPAVLEHYRGQFRSLLVDEFQDTNWAQYELIKLLAAPRNNVTVVGDDDQSIYKFRGASISNILKFKADFPAAAQVVLTQNFRSRQAILDFAYRFIQLNNPNRLEYQLSTGAAQGPLTTPISKKLTARRDGAGRVEVLEAPTQDDEADLVAESIVKLKAAQPDLSWGECAVLVRANDHAAAVLAAFKRKGIPHQFYASRGLYRKEEILDIVSYLKLLDNYHESGALYRVAQLPVFKLPTADLIELGHQAHKLSTSLFDVFRRAATVPAVSPEGKRGVETIIKLITRHTDDARHTSVMEIIMAFLSDSGLLKDYENPKDAVQYEKTKSVLRFLKLIQDFQRGHDAPTVKNFLEDFEAQREAGEQGSLGVDLDDSPDQVRVMTIHGAKGLEFSYVFVMHMVDKRFPTIERADPIPLPDALVKETLPEGDVHIQEERRLFYVASTRARDGLFFSRAEDYGGVQKKKPSVFLYEAGLLEPPAKIKSAATRAFPAPVIERPAPPLDPVLKRVIDQDNSFSYHKLHSYEICPWKYRYQHVLKVPGKQSGNASFGTSIHNTLYEFFKLLKQRSEAEQGSLFKQAGPQRKTSTEKNLVSEKELLEIYEKKWEPYWYDSEQHMKDRKAQGREALKRFYQDHQGRWPIPLTLEQDFAVKEGQITLVGKIDRIDTIDPTGDKPTVEIVDYKTSEGKKKLFKQSDKYQLFLYSLAVEDPQLFNLKVQKLTFSFILSGETQTYEPQAPDLESAKSWALGIIEKIKTGHLAATPGVVCRTCDFKDICPFRAA